MAVQAKSKMAEIDSTQKLVYSRMAAAILISQILTI